MIKNESEPSVSRQAPTDQLVQFLAETSEDDLSPHLFMRAKELLIDHLGVAYCGIHLPWSKMI